MRSRLYAMSAASVLFLTLLVHAQPAANPVAAPSDSEIEQFLLHAKVI